MKTEIDDTIGKQYINNVGWPSLCDRHDSQWYMFIYKAQLMLQEARMLL